MKANGIIINNENSFSRIFRFIEKYFDNVRVSINEYSYLARKSQNFYKIILFENRGVQFSVMWNYYHSVLFLGDITKNKKPCFQYSFTKMKFDNCYPVEEMNNYNVMFWETEIIDLHSNFGTPISPFRIHVDLKTINF